MRYKPKTSPVIRATLAAIEAVDRLHNTRGEEAKDDAERERIQSQYHDLLMTLMAILHEAQFGPPAPCAARSIIYEADRSNADASDGQECGLPAEDYPAGQHAACLAAHPGARQHLPLPPPCDPPDRHGLDRLAPA